MVDTPTADEIIERFPQFDGKDEQIELLIPEAALYVSDRWCTDSQKLAIMYMVAHLLSSEEAAVAAGGEVQSESFSLPGISESVTYRKDGSPLASTIFGQRYLGLFKRCFGGAGILVVP
jgi:hypothetical protein